jgi:hypothetical protein
VLVCYGLPLCAAIELSLNADFAEAVTFSLAYALLKTAESGIE